MLATTVKVEAEFLQAGETILMDGIPAKVLDLHGPWDGELSLTYSTDGIITEAMVSPRDLVEVL